MKDCTAACSPPNENGVEDGVNWGVPDVVLLAVGAGRPEGDWDLNVKAGLDERCAPVDDGVTIGGLEVEVVDVPGV